MKAAIKRSDLKQYPHFDAPLSVAEIERLVTDPTRVTQNSFFPLMLFREQWQPYRSIDPVKPEKKTRKIRYASRRDAYIFLHYRNILAEYYEKIAKDRGIADHVIAYRRIPRDPPERGGKSNIEFARDASNFIDTLQDCVAIAFDIEKFFENMDHSMIKEKWKILLNVSELPPDHYAVFKNITKYHYVEQHEVYRRLGIIGPRALHNKVVEGFVVPYRDMPKHLCSVSDFRTKICGENSKLPSLVKENRADRGVPQGAPISDLLANIYLMDFDAAVADYAEARGGLYRRYSDDILLILPGGESEANEATKIVTKCLSRYGKTLKIKESKTSIVKFRPDEDKGGLVYNYIEGKSKNGFEYLGFRYDGRNVYIRNGTIAGFFRKVACLSRASAKRFVLDNPGLDEKELLEKFDVNAMMERFLRVRRSKFNPEDYRTWTFWTYVKRAREAFGEKGNRITRQVKNVRDFARLRVEERIIQEKRRGA